MWKFGCLVLRPVKTMTYKIDPCRFQAWHSIINVIGRGPVSYAMDWNIRSWGSWPGPPLGQYYKVTMHTHCHKSHMRLNIAWTPTTNQSMLSMYLYRALSTCCEVFLFITCDTHPSSFSIKYLTLIWDRYRAMFVCI